VSTQINVTVGSGGLSDKAKQLQAAARQAQLEKERTAQIEADGTEQRNARLAANGQAPDGTSLYGVPTVVPFAERRPAANRPGAAYPVANGYFEDLGNIGYQNFSNYGTARNIKVYSYDKSSFVQIQIPLAEYPAPAFKYGADSYNSSYVYSNTEWEGQPWPYSLVNYPPQPGALNNYDVYAIDSEYNLSGTLLLRRYQDAWNPDTPLTSTQPASGYDLETFFRGNPQAIPVVSQFINSSFIPKPGVTQAHDTHSSTVFNSGLASMCLPLNKTSFILYLGSWDYKIRLYTGIQYDSEQEWVDFGNVNSNPEFSGNTYRIIEWCNLATNASIYKVDEFEETYIDSEVHEYCFLVTDKQVKQISVPQSLSTKVKTIYKHMESTPDIATTFADIASSTQVHSTVTNFSAYDGGGQPSDNWTKTITGQARPSLKRITQQGYNTDIANAKYSPVVEWSLLKQFGFGRLTTSQHLVSNAYTPSIFTALDNGSTIRLATDPNAFTVYQSVYNQYLNSTPFRQLWVNEGRKEEIVSGVFTVTRLYQYTKTKPINISTPVSIENFEENKVKPYPLDLQKTNFQVWDWASPGYCKSSLLSLGFTDADLTP
jgi:hypothetical protein